MLTVDEYFPEERGIPAKGTRIVNEDTGAVGRVVSAEPLGIKTMAGRWYRRLRLKIELEDSTAKDNPYAPPSVQ